ncbi:poly polymerase catalytic domain-containing protein [Colletotrichum acutatum]|uniref:Poly [ADP-ribose] polymerase n=1 Tax=Glomerella acutata TaxID=27357 RepID=A0AAD8XEE2_GLOAC|nr:poly polymerase catalytic domain-containing protein [Colletotrichum acutatum]KAK1724167.1 poly polymerase catalytic domain-containing protein [Colletotrichum acutatum]
MSAPRRSGRTAAAATSAAPTTPAAQPLAGTVIAISGTFDKKRTDLESWLSSLGAGITKSITKKTTHLVTTLEEFKAVTTKVASAQKNGIFIVTLDWAEKSESQGSKVAESDFEPGKPTTTKAKAAPAAATNGSTKKNGASAQSNSSQQNGSQPQSQASTTSKASAASKKRAKADVQSDNDSDADAKPNVKKQKAAAGAKGKKKAADSPVAADDADDKTDVKKKAATGDAQTASKGIVVPLDEGCKVQGNVYIAPDGVIYDASLNQTNASNNNNKFYRIQLVQDGKTFKTWTRWGRVGEFGQSAVLGNGSLDDALKNYDKKFKDKSGIAWAKRADPPKPGKYAFVERSYEPDSDDDENDEDEGPASDVKKEDDDSDDDMADPVKSSLPQPVQDLMGLIFNQQYFREAMTSMNYDANKLPLGKLSKNTILRGFQVLKDLAALFNDSTLADSEYHMSVPAATEHLSNSYYSLIPHAFGRNRPPIIGSGAMLKKEVDLLDSLSDMKVAADLMKVDRKNTDVHQADRQYQGLGMEEMTPLDRKSPEFTLLAEYLNGSKGSTHGHTYKIEDIFRIERQGELERFEKSEFSSIKSDRRLLWHGSRVTNYGGILSQGLRIAPPEAPVSGYMFGKGIYLADMSSKSANYCASYNSGGQALLLLCEAELGDPIQKLTNASYNAGDDAKAGGMWSTWGQGNTGPSKWKDASCVNPDLKGIQMPDVSVTPGPTNVPGAYLMYNEYIAYDLAQVRLRYLFRVKM